MDFTYDETHLAVKQAATDVLDSAAAEAAWKALGQAGLLSLGRPQSLGGDGLGMVDAGIVLTEIGRRALITPAFPALPLDLALTRAGHSALLPPDSFLTYAFTATSPGPAIFPAAATSPLSPADSPDAAAADDDLAGADAEMAVGGASADGASSASGVVALRAVVAVGRASAAGGVAALSAVVAVGGASVGGAAVADGRAAVAGVPFAAEASGVMVLKAGEAAPSRVTTAEAGYSSSGIPEYTVTLEAAGQGVQADCYPYLLAGAAAFADGLLAGALTLTTEHLRTREQFGKPLATFQIAAALIADVYIASRTMHLIALSLAWGLDTGRDITADVEAAEHWLRNEAVGALRTCHHLHGGIGLDVTYPLHRYYSLMKDLVRYVHRPH